MKIKKLTRSLITAAMATILCMSIMIPFTLNAQALSQPNQDPTDYLFQTLAALGETPDGEYEVHPTYSHDLTENGLQYTFTVNGKPAYTLMLSFKDSQGNIYHEITEIFLDSLPPFESSGGMFVYISKFTYFYFAEGKYVTTVSKEEFTYEQLAEISEKHGFTFGDYGDDFTSKCETIVFARRATDSYEFPNGLPGYANSSMISSCANIAGGNILGYYDIKFPNLIPDCETAYESNGKMVYHYQPKKVTDIISNDLFNDMGTIEGKGTTFEGFKTGLTKYVNRQGYKANYYEAAPNGKLDYEEFRTQIFYARPVALFLSSYNVSFGPLTKPNKGEDDLCTNYFNSNHVMVASGYMKMEYYNSNLVIFRRDTYLKISSGYPTLNIGYMRINTNENFEHAIGVQIY